MRNSASGQDIHQQHTMDGSRPTDTAVQPCVGLWSLIWCPPGLQSTSNHQKQRTKQLREALRRATRRWSPLPLTTAPAATLLLSAATARLLLLRCCLLRRSRYEVVVKATSHEHAASSRPVRTLSRQNHQHLRQVTLTSKPWQCSTLVRVANDLATPEIVRRETCANNPVSQAGASSIGVLTRKCLVFAPKK